MDSAAWMAYITEQQALNNAKQDIANITNQLNATQQQVNDEANQLSGANQQINVLTNQVAAAQQQVDQDATTLQSDASIIASLQQQMVQSDSHDYVNMKNLIDAYRTGVAHNKSLLSSSAITSNMDRLNELGTTHSSLTQKKAELISSIEQHERDFVDLRDALPEILPNTSIHTLDDYTLWILILSYSLFVISMIFYYCYINAYTPTSILISIVSAAILTIFLFIIIIIVL